jgi:hypothetical protein
MIVKETDSCAGTTIYPMHLRGGMRPYLGNCNLHILQFSGVTQKVIRHLKEVQLFVFSRFGFPLIFDP